MTAFWGKEMQLSRGNALRPAMPLPLKDKWMAEFPVQSNGLDQDVAEKIRLPGVQPAWIQVPKGKYSSIGVLEEIPGPDLRFLLRSVDDIKALYTPKAAAM